MNDNEIIKALEMCGNIVVSSCKECSFHISYNANCVKQVMRNALDLITRQKAELKQKDTEIDILIRKKETLKDEVSELQHKNSELEIELKAMRGAANSYKAEVKRLQREQEIFGDIGKLYSEVKADAYKELANLIERGLNSNTPRGAYLINIVDEVLTELTER